METLKKYNINYREIITNKTIYLYINVFSHNHSQTPKIAK